LTLDISVVIASYNHAPFVEACILSALEQTHPPAEVIVVDDGSSDGSADVIESFGRDVRAVFQPNRGTYATLNAGIAMASHGWVAIHNSDDLWGPNKLAAQAEIAASDPRIGLVHTGVAYMDAAGATIEDVPGADLRSYSAASSYEALPVVLRTNPVVISSALLSRRCWEAAGRFDERYLGMGDWEFCVRAARHHRFGFAPGPLTRVRKHPASAGMDASRLPADWIGQDWKRLLTETMPNCAAALVEKAKRGEVNRQEAAVSLASLGMLQMRERQHGPARASLRMAIGLDPLRAKSYLRYLQASAKRRS
jgi:glycosyltransferase involved in cell wall biosynthesis